jgi:hypothetical protein
MMVALKGKNSTEAKLSPKSEILPGKVILTLPIHTVSEANNFDHYRIKHKRHVKQKKIVALFLNPVKSSITLPCNIKIIRLAPKKVDKWDNLPMSVKWILDACCAIITGDFRPGRADDDKRITVEYDQVLSPAYGVIIEIKNV